LLRIIFSSHARAEETLNGRKIGDLFRKEMPSFKGFMACHRVVRKDDGTLIEQQTCEESCYGPVDGRKFIPSSCI